MPRRTEGDQPGTFRASPSPGPGRQGPYRSGQAPSQLGALQGCRADPRTPATPGPHDQPALETRLPAGLGGGRRRGPLGRRPRPEKHRRGLKQTGRPPITRRFFAAFPRASRLRLAARQVSGRTAKRLPRWALPVATGLAGLLPGSGVTYLAASSSDDRPKAQNEPATFQMGGSMKISGDYKSRRRRSSRRVGSRAARCGAVPATPWRGSWRESRARSMRGAASRRCRGCGRPRRSRCLGLRPCTCAGGPAGVDAAAVWSLVRRAMANTAFDAPDDLDRTLRRELRTIRLRPHLINGCLTATDLTLDPPTTLKTSVTADRAEECERSHQSPSTTLAGKRF